ncbi:MAG TPA: aminoacyl-tRNA hydrolase [Chloroflexia bacterium]|nr:aminoacyl-tRNA hydrolase [Chloroflexia bacterium]
MARNPGDTNAPFLIVGLGNPGPRYAATRHNAGFMVVDELARRHGLRLSGRQANSHYARGEIAGRKVILAQPQTYMNNSGQAVRTLASYYKVPTERVVIIYDEVALPTGTIRVREKGTSAGHNGVKSVIHYMGTEAIPRIRVGVDRPADPRHKQMDWVLGRFTKEEQPLIEDAIRRAADAVEYVLSNGFERAMNVYNTADAQPAPPKKTKPAPAPPAEAAAEAKPQRDKRDLSLDTIRERLARIMHADRDI